MKQPGIHQIAELAKVSIGTVDRALHGRDGISESTRTKVLRIAKQLGYKPNLAARALSVARANVRIGVCIPKEIHFFYDQMRDGIFDEVRRVSGMGVQVIYRPVPSLGEEEKETLEELLQSGIQALIVTPGNPAVVSPLIDQAEKKGVRVICITSDAPESHRSTFVGVDPELNGRLAAELLSMFIPGGSKAAIVTGMLETQEHRKKAEGFRAALPDYCSGGEVVEVVEGHESEQATHEKCCQLLNRYPDLAGIYVSTVNCLPVCRALDSQASLRRTKLVTTDLFEGMVPHFIDGTIAASIYQDPYLQGQMAARIAVDYYLGDTQIKSANYLNPGIVLKTNLHLFREVAQLDSSPASGAAEDSRSAALSPEDLLHTLRAGE